MTKAFLALWLLIRYLVLAISVVIQFVIGVVLFLAATAEITSFVLNNDNFIIDNIRNLAGRIAYVKIPTPVATGAPPAQQCTRYEKRLIDLHCDEKAPAERLLCQVTVRPVEIVCADEPKIVKNGQARK